MSDTTEHRPLVLMILDGWGCREPADDNAIHLARTPTWDRLWAECPHALLDTSGEAVGLPEGQMGNSEVGHMNIGAGRVVYQDFTRITRAIDSAEFDDNPALVDGIDAARDAGGAVHVMGLLSPGGVHSHEEHFIRTLELAAERGAGPVYAHAFLDGRDVPPKSAGASLDRLDTLAGKSDAITVASVCGRYYAMDRDQRWPRVRRAWDAIVDGNGDHRADSGRAALRAAYRRDESDEFVEPTVIGDFPGVRDGDAVIFVNFRADRARQLSRAFVEEGFDGFEARRPRLSAFVTMTEYLDGLPASVAFPPGELPDLFGEVISRAGLKQLRLAETEKYAHVTFFFNGGEETPFDGESRILVPSPDVATYDLRPEMSAPEVASRLDGAIRGGEFDVIICNIANPDMVGHSGNLGAAMQAVEAVDAVLKRCCEALDAVGGELLITADHGNVEQMSDPESGQRHTAHTTNPVPLLFRGRAAGGMAERGALRDIAPTMLALLGLDAPDAMTGRALIRGIQANAA